MENHPTELKACDRDFIVALHEAGHAVACHRLGVPYRQVSIEAQSGAGVQTEVVARPVQGATGAAEYALQLETYAARCRAQVIVAFAGRIAEVRAAQCGLTAAVGLSSGRKDERDAQFFAREMLQARSDIASAQGEPEVHIEELPRMLVAELGVLRRESEALFGADFAAIEKVARRLVEAGRLTCEDVKSMMT